MTAKPIYFTPVRLTLSDVVLARGERVLTRGISTEVAPGGLVVLRGANGAGKTTLLRAIAGFTPLAGGAITITHEGAAMEPAEAAVLVGHADGLRRTETPRAHLDFIARWLGPAEGAAERVAGALKVFGLGPIADAPARRLSAGQRRRAALARLIAAPRPLWLLDEPAAPLDAAGRETLARLIAAHRSSGGAVVAAVHGETGWPGAMVLDFDALAPSPRAA